MSQFVPHNNAMLDTFLKKHDFSTDVLKVYLSNTTPDPATHFTKSQLAEISAGNGYAAGGEPLDVQEVTQTDGVASVVLANDEKITASGGTIGPFRYAVFYNDTHASKPIIAHWDYGSAITLQDGEEIVLDFPPVLLSGAYAAVA